MRDSSSLVAEAARRTRVHTLATDPSKIDGATEEEIAAARKEYASWKTTMPLCPVCGEVAMGMVIEYDKGTRWEPCNHSSLDLLQRGEVPTPVITLVDSVGLGDNLRPRTPRDDEFVTITVRRGDIEEAAADLMRACGEFCIPSDRCECQAIYDRLLAALPSEGQ